MKFFSRGRKVIEVQTNTQLSLTMDYLLLAPRIINKQQRNNKSKRRSKPKILINYKTNKNLNMCLKKKINRNKTLHEEFKYKYAYIHTTTLRCRRCFFNLCIFGFSFIDFLLQPSPQCSTRCLIMFLCKRVTDNKLESRQLN